MLTSLGGGLLGLFGRRFLITAWLPSLLYWAGFGSLVVTGTGWHQAVGWWLRQPAEFKVVLAGLALAWVTFFAYLLVAWTPLVIRLAEGYWPQRRPWSRLSQRRRETYARRLKSMQRDPGKFPRAYLDYPLRPSRVMPTRLGNILRSAEDYAQERYQINSIVVWPRLYVLLPDQFIAAVAAAKTPLDLMAALAALASLFAVSGTAVAVALLPWYAALACFAGGVLITWLGYGGAVQAARPYGQLIRAAFDIHRGLLLDAIGWTRPPSYAAERRQWQQISRLWYQGAPENAAGARLLGYPGAQAMTTLPNPAHEPGTGDDIPAQGVLAESEQLADSAQAGKADGEHGYAHLGHAGRVPRGNGDRVPAERIGDGRRAYDLGPAGTYGPELHATGQRADLIDLRGRVTGDGDRCVV
jgi:hypothetical protein